MLSLTVFDILTHPFKEASNAAIITLLILIFSNAVFLINWFLEIYKSKFPFKMDIFQDTNYKDIQPDGESNLETIQGINGLYPGTLTLRIRPKKGTILEEVNVRFVKREWYIFYDNKYSFKRKPLWKWVNVSADIISIKSLKDPKVQEEFGRATTRQFNASKDGAGGCDGLYRPALNCSKGNVVWMTIEIQVHVRTEWKGYISFQLKTGNIDRAYARKKLIFRNKQV